MNERMQILKMLEDGKINAQEAERLLEALSHSASRERKNKFKIWSSIEGIPKFISAAIGNSFTDSETVESMHYDAKKRLSFNGVSGNLEISGTDTTKITVERDGFSKIKEDDETLSIKTLSGDVKVQVPRNIDISVTGISGDISITDINGTTNIESVSGNFTGKGLSGSVFGEFVSGDIDILCNKFEKIKIKSRSGDVTLQLDKKVEAEIEMETGSGSMQCDFDLLAENRSKNELKGIINKPTGQICIKSKSGDLSIKKIL